MKIINTIKTETFNEFKEFILKHNIKKDSIIRDKTNKKYQVSRIYDNSIVLKDFPIHLMYITYDAEKFLKFFDLSDKPFTSNFSD